MTSNMKIFDSMKRYLIAAVAVLMLFTSFDASARGRKPQTQRYKNPMDGFGLTFGYVHSSYRTTDWATDEVVKSAGLDGFRAGIIKDFTLIRDALYFQTALEYVYQNDARNEVMEVGDLAFRIIGDRNEHYVMVPLRLRYTYPVTPRVAIGADFGPSFLAGVASNMKYRTRISEDAISSATYDIYKGKFIDSQNNTLFSVEDWMETVGMLPDGRLQRFDVLLGASVCATFLDIFDVKIGYDWGLVNRYKKEVAYDLKMKRSQLTISVGVKF